MQRCLFLIVWCSYLGHSHIDILKIDIEGWEFDTLTTLVNSYLESGQPLPFGQLELEIHAWHKTFPEFLAWWEKLEQAGLRPFMTEVRRFNVQIEKT
jgi:Methyltransferase FkbM domain